jgi:hypothetical protein
MRALGAILLLGMVTSTAAAAPMAGTEEQPELTDPAGNVNYSAGYVGPKDRSHVDLLAAWYEYAPQNDTVQLTIKVTDLSHLMTAAQDWNWRCNFLSNMTDGKGAFVYQVTKLTHGEIHSSLWHYQQVTRSGTAYSGTDGRPIDHTWSASLSEPGYVRMWVNRTEYLRSGFAMQSFYAQCVESMMIPGGPSNVPLPITNANVAGSSGTYDFGALHPADSPEHRDDLPTRAATASSPADAAKKSSGLAFGIGISVLLIAALSRARRN